MKTDMKSSKFIESILKEFAISISGLAILIEVNPATIHRWINDEMEISQENIDKINEISSIINSMANRANCNVSDIIKTLVNLKKSPLWRGWDHAAQMLGSIDVTLQNENYLKRHLLQNHHLIEENLRPLKRIPTGVDIDALFKDKKGNHVAFKFYKKNVATDEYGKVKFLLSNISENIGKRYKLILAAPRFVGTFVEVSSKEKNLKLVQYDFNTEEVHAVGIL
ncbi:MAG: hypothetical protein ISR65_16355 [Bacteriovoracaceae bacterium]|nr:hypothetical protein [Bacteriovoracaceae bacterium]